MKNKVFIISIICLLLLNFSIAAETSLITPEHDSQIDLSQENLIVEWESTQDHSSQDVLLESEILAEDESGNTVEEIIERSETLNQDESVVDSYTFDYARFDKLEDGFWEIKVTDIWEEEDVGVNIKDSDQHVIEVQNSPSESDETDSDDGGSGDENIFVLEVIEPSESTTHDTGNSLSVDWGSENQGDASKTLLESTVQVKDGAGRSEEENIVRETSVDSESRISYEVEFSVDRLSNYEEGEWTLTVTDIWEDGDTNVDEKTEIVFQVNETSDELDNELQGSASASIEKPSGEQNVEQDLVVEWVSENDFDSDVELSEASLELEGAVGRTVSEEININELVGAGESVSSSFVFNSDSFSSFSEGEWTLTVEDYWGSGDSFSQSTSFTMSGNVEDSTDSDSEENETSTEDTEDTDESSDSCPEGFVYDAERDVCLEDSEDDSGAQTGDEGGSSQDEDSFDSMESDDDSEESSIGDSDSIVSNQGLDYGPSVSGVPLWPIALVLALSGVLFWRSDYELDF